METDGKRLSLIRFYLIAGKEFDYTRRITGIKDFVLLVFGWGGVSLENGLIVGGRFGIFGLFANSFADRIRKTKGATE